MNTEIEITALNYLKSKFEIVENIPDVNNRIYNAKPTFIKEDKPITGLFSDLAKIGDTEISYRSYSPTNHAGKMKEGYYVVSYHIESKGGDEK